MSQPQTAQQASHEMASKQVPLIRWQKPMIAVLIACIPAMLSAAYRFGWRCMALTTAVAAVAFFCEWLFTHKRKEPVSSAVFVTAVLLTLTLPPAIPFWIAIVGAVVAVFFGKEFFGGFGRNVFNPALVGRCFIFICFPVFMTGRWSVPYTGAFEGMVNWFVNQWNSFSPWHIVWSPPQLVTGWGGLAHWSAKSIEIVTGATPLDAWRINKVGIQFVDLLIGNRAGCMGETMMIAIILGGLYLMIRKVADWRLTIGSIAGFLLLGYIFQFSGVKGVADPLWGILAGGFMFGAVFMITDPVSASRTPTGKWIYALMVGMLVTLLRRFGTFPEGMMFVILLMNTFVPVMDIAVRAATERKAATA